MSHGNFTFVHNTSSGRYYNEGTVVTVVCDDGYGPKYGASTATCTGGNWLPTTPECNCKHPPIMLEGSYVRSF